MYVMCARLSYADIGDNVAENVKIDDPLKLIAIIDKEIFFLDEWNAVHNRCMYLYYILAINKCSSNTQTSTQVKITFYA